MRKILASTFGLVVFSVVVQAQEIQSSSLMSDIGSLAKKCTVRMVQQQDHAHKRAVGYVSKCPTLVKKTDSLAQVYVDGAWYKAVLTESADSDGGDLDDLTVYDQDGNVVGARKNVAAFDNVLVALAGGDRFQQEVMIGSGQGDN